MRAKRLGQILQPGPFLLTKRFHQGAEFPLPEARGENDRNLPISLGQAVQSLRTPYIGQRPVQENQGDLLGALPEHGLSFMPIPSSEHIAARLFKDPLKDLGNMGIVFDHEDPMLPAESDLPPAFGRNRGDPMDAILQRQEEGHFGPLSGGGLDLDGTLEMFHPLDHRGETKAMSLSLGAEKGLQNFVAQFLPHPNSIILDLDAEMGRAGAKTPEPLSLFQGPLSRENTNLDGTPWANGLPGVPQEIEHCLPQPDRIAENLGEILSDLQFDANPWGKKHFP